MKKSAVHALASGSATFKRFRQLSLRRLHSDLGVARHGALRHIRRTSLGALRALASKVGHQVALAERFHIDRQLPQGPAQYTSGLASLAGTQSQWRSRRAPFLAVGRANLSFKRTRLRRSA